MLLWQKEKATIEKRNKTNHAQTKQSIKIYQPYVILPTRYIKEKHCREKKEYFEKVCFPLSFFQTIHVYPHAFEQLFLNSLMYSK